MLKLYKKFRKSFVKLLLPMLVGVLFTFAASLLPQFSNLISGLMEEMPEIQIVFEPTEKYTVGGNILTLKRITVTNKSHELDSLKITIQVPLNIESMHFQTDPIILGKYTEISGGEFKKEYLIEFSSLFPNQQIFISLATSEHFAMSGRIIVKSVALYDGGKKVGYSIEGSID